jgi:SAM-dependent methyltransferase
VSTWSPALRMWESAIADIAQGSALEVGAREGGLSLWLARAGFRVDCTDVANTSELAQPSHSRSEHNPEILARITYRDLDATLLDVQEVYDLVVVKSVFGGIGGSHGRSATIKAVCNIHAALKPGGKLLFAENLRGSYLLRKLRRSFTSWGSRWDYMDEDEILDLMEGFSSVTTETAGIVAALGRTENQRRLLSKLDRALSRCTPTSWRYVCFGYATK